ncbi:MAG: hypothetical protein IJ180_01815 [Bacteroidales bacterium]|nr:hypothetical protein [Bacteroidales bacterium]
MKRKFLFMFCLMTLPLYVFSQMQSVISTSTERVLDGVNVYPEKVKRLYYISFNNESIICKICNNLPININ